VRTSKRFGSLVAVAVALVVLGGCSFWPRVGVRTNEARQPVVEIARCSGQGVTSVELIHGTFSSDPVIWRVESEGVPVDSVTVGQTPPGFVETVPLTTIVRSDTAYQVVVRSTGSRTESEVFTPSELTTDRVRVNGSSEPLINFRSRSDTSCDNFAGFGVAFGVAFFVFFGLWIAGAVFWIVKLVQVARIPEYQFRAAGSEKTTWVLVVVLAQIIGALIWQFGPRKRVLAMRGMPPPAPPGWYQGPGGWQWWDGQRWLLPYAPPPPTPFGAPPPPPGAPPVSPR
jgi:hypothetical protein